MLDLNLSLVALPCLALPHPTPLIIMWTVRALCSTGGRVLSQSSHGQSQSKLNHILVPKRLFRKKGQQVSQNYIILDAILQLQLLPISLNVLFIKKNQDGHQPHHIRREGNSPASPVLMENGASAQGSGAPAQNKWRIVAKQFLFTGGVCAASYAGAAVWQYENMRAEAMKNKWRQVWGQIR